MKNKTSFKTDVSLGLRIYFVVFSFFETKEAVKVRLFGVSNN